MERDQSNTSIDLKPSMIACREFKEHCYLYCVHVVVFKYYIDLGDVAQPYLSTHWAGERG